MENVNNIQNSQLNNNVVTDDGMAMPTISTTRKMLVVGCGDGGCNIASAIVQSMPNDCYGIAYNLSSRAMQLQQSNTRIWPMNIDGSGKFRDDATATFKKVTGATFINRVMEVTSAMGHCDYVLVIGTSDGGTGSGTVPTMVKLIKKNLEIPVVVMGVYPSIKEDAMSQYNAIQWQKDITATGAPYIILDNNVEKTLVNAHEAVNNYAVKIAQLLGGYTYGNTDISIIDNRNLYMLVEQIGGRIVIATDEGRIDSQDNLDEHILSKILPNCYQPEPSNVRGIGIFVKGPKALIEKVDTDLVEIQKRYGQAVLKFAHLEISDKTAVSILLSGCNEPEARLQIMRDKHADVTSKRPVNDSVSGDLASTMENPLGVMKTATRKVSLDLSVLED